MTKEQTYEEWHPLIRNCLKNYISTHKTLASSYDDLYQECYATFLRLKQKNPDFQPSYLRVKDVIRRYFLTVKMFTVHGVVEHGSVSETGKEIDKICIRVKDISELTSVEDTSISNVYEDIDTFVDWDHFCELQGETDSKILSMKAKGMTNTTIAKELGISSPAVLKRLRKLSVKYHEWLEAS